MDNKSDSSGSVWKILDKRAAAQTDVLAANTVVTFGGPAINVTPGSTAQPPTDGAAARDKFWLNDTTFLAGAVGYPLDGRAAANTAALGQLLEMLIEMGACEFDYNGMKTDAVQAAIADLVGAIIRKYNAESSGKNYAFAAFETETWADPVALSQDVRATAALATCASMTRPEILSILSKSGYKGDTRAKWIVETLFPEAEPARYDDGPEVRTNAWTEAIETHVSLQWPLVFHDAARPVDGGYVKPLAAEIWKKTYGVMAKQPVLTDRSVETWALTRAAFARARDPSGEYYCQIRDAQALELGLTEQLRLAAARRKDIRLLLPFKCLRDLFDHEASGRVLVCIAVMRTLFGHKSLAKMGEVGEMQNWLLKQHGAIAFKSLAKGPKAGASGAGAAAGSAETGANLRALIAGSATGADAAVAATRLLHDIARATNPAGHDRYAPLGNEKSLPRRLFADAELTSLELLYDVRSPVDYACASMPEIADVERKTLRYYPIFTGAPVDGSLSSSAFDKPEYTGAMLALARQLNAAVNIVNALTGLSATVARRLAKDGFTGDVADLRFSLAEFMEFPEIELARKAAWVCMERLKRTMRKRALQAARTSTAKRVEVTLGLPASGLHDSLAVARKAADKAEKKAFGPSGANGDDDGSGSDDDDRKRGRVASPPPDDGRGGRGSRRDRRQKKKKKPNARDRGRNDRGGGRDPGRNDSDRKAEIAQLHTACAKWKAIATGGGRQQQQQQQPDFRAPSGPPRPGGGQKGGGGKKPCHFWKPETQSGCTKGDKCTWLHAKKK